MDMGIWVSPCLQGMFYLFCSFVLLGIFLVSFFISRCWCRLSRGHVRATARVCALCSLRDLARHARTVAGRRRHPAFLLSFDIFHNIFFSFSDVRLFLILMETQPLFAEPWQAVLPNRALCRPHHAGERR